MKKVNHLSKKDQKFLNNLYHYDKKRRVRLRSHILLLSYKGISINDLIKIFNLDFDTVSDLISAYNKTGISALYDKPRSGRPASLSAQYAQDYILEKIAKDSRNINLILTGLEENFNIKIAKSTLIRFLKKKSIYGKGCVNP